MTRRRDVSFYQILFECKNQIFIYNYILQYVYYISLTSMNTKIHSFYLLNVKAHEYNFSANAYKDHHKFQSMITRIAKKLSNHKQKLHSLTFLTNQQIGK